MQSLRRFNQNFCAKCFNGFVNRRIISDGKNGTFSAGRSTSSYTPDNDVIRVGIIGAPMAKGQRKEGVDKGPNEIRKGGLVDTLENLGVIVRDYGNVEFENISKDEPFGKIRNPLYVFNALKKVSEQVSNILRQDDQICLTLGGDHSLGISTVHGHYQVFKDKVCLLWVDAHADINTAQTTNSGNIHGMPISFLLHELKYNCPTVPGLEWLKPCLRANSIAYIGLRDVEPSEMLILHNLGIKYFSMNDIDKYGIHTVVQRAMDSVNPRGDKYIHVSFDIDAVDKVLAPSTGTPVSGGLTRREALSIAEEISSTGFLVGLDLVEVNPMLGKEDDVRKTVSMAVDIIAAFFGRQRTGISLPCLNSLPKP